MSNDIYLDRDTCACGRHEKKNVDGDDTGDSSYEPKDETLEIPMENDHNNITCTRRQNSQMHEIRSAAYNQFPFMVAIMSQQNEYLCSGCIVSNGIILTTATCTQKPISTVLLNTTTDKIGETTISLHVIKSERFPTFTSESTKDVGIVYTEKHDNSIATKIKLSSYTNPRNLLDIEGIGFGLNADVGQTNELQYVGMEVRYIPDVVELMKGYFDCVETKVPTCFRDTGGPVLFDNKLVGIIVKGQTECTKEMSATYAVNKKMVDFVPTYVFKKWLDEKIIKNEEKEPRILSIYPSPPALKTYRRHKMTSEEEGGGAELIGISKVVLSGFLSLLLFLNY